MAKRQRLCPEITDPELRGFLDMLPDIRTFNREMVFSQERFAQTTEFALPGRTISICFHHAKDSEGNLLPGNHPVLFEFHGGGFMMGNAEKTDALCEQLARELGIHVIGVNYRLAPENPFPAAVKDAYQVIRRIWQKHQEYRIDPMAMAVMGYSAGATLSTAAAMQAVLNQEFSLKAQILHYPYLDAVHMPEEKKHYVCDMDSNVMNAFTRLYSAPQERTNPYVSPVCAKTEELKGCAPALILPAERDALKEEALIYAEHLRSAGCEVKLQIIENVHHGYLEDAANPEVYAQLSEDIKKTHDTTFWNQAEMAMNLTKEFLREKLSL